MTFASRSTQCTLTGWAMDLTWKDNRGAGAVVESKEDIFEVQDRAFVEAVTSGDRSGILSPYADAVGTLRVTLAAEQSALTGRIVAV